MVSCTKLMCVLYLPDKIKVNTYACSKSTMPQNCTFLTCVMYGPILSLICGGNMVKYEIQSSHGQQHVVPQTLRLPMYDTYITTIEVPLDRSSAI